MNATLRTEFIPAPATRSRNDLKTVLVLLSGHERLRSLLSAYLRASGYELLVCTSPESARRKFRDVQGAVDLLLTDVSADLSTEAEVSIDLWMYSDGRLKVLYLSNRALNDWSVFDTAMFLQLPPDSVRVLQKPFSVLDLLIHVNELIGLPEERMGRQASA
jgi:DNA-binding response OmpR family regulator